LSGQDLGGLTLTPGVYYFATSAQLTGRLTLDGEGESDPFFDIQIGSTLTTASAASIVLENDAQAANVFWQVGSAATLGTGTTFQGNILAETSISDAGGSTVYGRLLALGGAVTLIDTTVNVPQAEGSGGAAPDTGSTLLLLGSALAALFAFGRRFSVLLR
jgi:type VI secretion system secreted protein VgrG